MVAVGLLGALWAGGSQGKQVGKLLLWCVDYAIYGLGAILKAEYENKMAEIERQIAELRSNNERMAAEERRQERELTVFYENKMAEMERQIAELRSNNERMAAEKRRQEKEAM